MVKALLNIKVQPCRMLKKLDAAAYCGLTPTGFERNCMAVPVKYPDGTILWDVRDLDAWLDALKTGQTDTDDDILNQLGS